MLAEIFITFLKLAIRIKTRSCSYLAGLLQICNVLTVYTKSALLSADPVHTVTEQRQTSDFEVMLATILIPFLKYRSAALLSY